MFLRMVILGKRLKCWNTMPICRRMRSISTLGSVISVRQGDAPLVGISSRFRHRRRWTFPSRRAQTTTFSPGGCARRCHPGPGGPQKTWRCLTSITLPQPPFQFAQKPAEDNDQHQVEGRGADQGEHLLIGPVVNALGGIQQLLAADDRDEGGVLSKMINSLPRAGRMALMAWGMTINRMVVM